MDYGIDVVDLFKSDVFRYKFEFDTWPNVHTDTEKYLKPYNGSIFDIRSQYKSIFPDIEDIDLVDNEKRYKITYSLSLLPSISEPEDIDDFMNLLAEMTEED